MVNTCESLINVVVTYLSGSEQDLLFFSMQ